MVPKPILSSRKPNHRLPSLTRSKQGREILIQGVCGSSLTFEEYEAKKKQQERSTLLQHGENMSTPHGASMARLRHSRGPYVKPAMTFTNSFTASTLFWNAAFSSAFNSSLDDPLDAAGAKNNGHADVIAADAVLFVAIGRGRNEPLLVANDGLDHLGGGRGRRVIGAAGLQQADDFGSAIARAIDDFVEPAARSRSTG